MTDIVSIHKSVPAARQVSGWLNRALGPALMACRFACPIPPIELRPMECGGYALEKSCLTDRRVCLNSRAIFWSRNRLIYVALHEVAHRLVMEWAQLELGERTHSHGPVFFLTLAVMCERADSEIKEKPNLLLDMKLYDFQDYPDSKTPPVRSEWMPEVLGWALSHVEDLARSAVSAESIPSEAARLWLDHLEKKRDEVSVLTKCGGQIEHLQEQNQVLQMWLKLLSGLAGISMVVLFALLW